MIFFFFRKSFIYMTYILGTIPKFQALYCVSDFLSDMKIFLRYAKQRCIVNNT